MRRFIFRILFGVAGIWVASILIPGVTTDQRGMTFLLAGVFIAVGEMALPFVESATAIVFFFLPHTVRMFALRVAVIAIAVQLTDGLGFSAPLPGLLGTTFVISLLYALPFAR